MTALRAAAATGRPDASMHGRDLRSIRDIDKDLASAYSRPACVSISWCWRRTWIAFISISARRWPRGLDAIAAEDLRRHAAAGQFPAGSMGPKVEAALRFVDAGGRKAIVTSYEQLAVAVQGDAGTRVYLAACQSIDSEVMRQTGAVAH